MDASLEMLEQKQECLNDEILVQQVRLQLIVEKTNLGIWHDETTENTEHTRAPPLFYFQGLQSQLQEIKNKLLYQSQQNGNLSLAGCSVILSNSLAEVVLAHLYSTELTVNETALSQVPIMSEHSQFQRLKYLYACVECIKSWFENFFTIQPTAYVGFPFLIFSQLVHSLVALYKISILDDPAWDKSGLRKTADLLSILDHVISNMEQVQPLAGLDNNGVTEEDAFFRTAKVFRSIRPAWETKLELDNRVVFTLPSPQQNPNDVPLTEPFPMDFSDYDWMVDFLPIN